MVVKAEDEAVDKLVEKAAVEAEERMAQGSVPQVEMRKGHQQGAATSGVEAKTDKEPMTTEADVVAPAAGTRVGDRVVGSKPERTKKTKKTSSVKVSPRRKKTVRCRISYCCDQAHKGNHRSSVASAHRFCPPIVLVAFLASAHVHLVQPFAVVAI